MVAKNPAPMLTTSAMTRSQTIGARYLLMKVIMMHQLTGSLERF